MLCNGNFQSFAPRGLSEQVFVKLWPLKKRKAFLLERGRPVRISGWREKLWSLRHGAHLEGCERFSALADGTSALRPEAYFFLLAVKDKQQLSDEISKL